MKAKQKKRGKKVYGRQPERVIAMTFNVDGSPPHKEVHVVDDFTS